MQYKYYTCDVFTNKRFGGNQLAVFPEASGLSGKQMQQIAREFNFSESTFVFPPEKGKTCKVRIFTPTSEVPFAGHPNVGTAFILATIGELGKFKGTTKAIFEESAGPVPITINRRSDLPIWCELEAPEKFSVGKTISARRMASLISVTEQDIITTTHLPQLASVGMAFLFTELRDVEVLGRAKVNLDQLAAIAAEGMPSELHLYAHTKGDFDIRARMFAPLVGIAEDPATGSANCALAGLLSHYNSESSREFKWRIAQGLEMGRPSILDARTEKKDGVVQKTWIGGFSVKVSEGIFEIE